MTTSMFLQDLVHQKMKMKIFWSCTEKLCHSSHLATIIERCNDSMQLVLPDL